MTIFLNIKLSDTKMRVNTAKTSISKDFFFENLRFIFIEISGAPYLILSLINFTPKLEKDLVVTGKMAENLFALMPYVFGKVFTLMDFFKS